MQRINSGAGTARRHARQRIVRSLRRGLSAFDTRIATGHAPKGKAAAG